MPRLACSTLAISLPWLVLLGCGDDGGTGGGDAGSASASSSQMAASSSGGSSCVPGAVLPCYSGPAGTDGVGVCGSGAQTCAPDGSGYGACQGETLPSAENCASPLDEDCDGVSQACTGVLLETRTAQGTNPELYGLAFDDEGALYGTGIFAGEMDFGSGSLTSAGDTDGFAVSFSPDTTPAGAIRFGDAGHEEALSIAAMPASGFAITGRASQTVDFATVVAGDPPYATFVGLFTPSMQIRWARGFTSTGPSYVREVSVNDAGRVAVVGYFENTIDLGAGPMTAAGLDAYVAVYDEATPTLIWSRALSSAGEDQAENVSIDDEGSVFVSVYHGDSLTLDGVTVAGSGRAVLKLDPDGAAVFAVDSGDTVAADQLGGVVVGSNGSLRRVDAAGVEAWSVPGGYGVIALDPFGNTVAYRYTGEHAILKVDPEGNTLFENPVDFYLVRSMAVDATGRFAISGRVGPQDHGATVSWYAP